MTTTMPNVRQKKAEAALTLNNLGEIGSLLSSLIGSEHRDAKEREKRKRQEKMEKAKQELLAFHQQSKTLSEKQPKKKPLTNTTTTSVNSHANTSEDSSELKPKAGVAASKNSAAGVRTARRKKAATARVVQDDTNESSVQPTSLTAEDANMTKHDGITKKNNNSKDAGFESDLSESANRDEIMVECETTMIMPDDNSSGRSSNMSGKHVWTRGMGDSGLDVDTSEASTADEVIQESGCVIDIGPDSSKCSQAVAGTYLTVTSGSAELSTKQPTFKKWTGNFRVQRMGWEHCKAGVKVHMANVSWRLFANLEEIQPSFPQVATSPAETPKQAEMTKSYLDELDDHVPELPSPKPKSQGSRQTKRIQRRSTTGSLGSNAGSQLSDLGQLVRPRLQRQANISTPTTAQKQNSATKPGGSGSSFAFALDASALDHISVPNQLMLRRTNLKRQKSAPVRPANSAQALFHVRRQVLKRQTSQPIPRGRGPANVDPEPEPEWFKITLRPTPLPKEGLVIVCGRKVKRSPSPPPFVHIVLKPIERVFDNLGRSKPAPVRRPIPPKPKAAPYVPKWRRASSAEENETLST